MFTTCIHAGGREGSFHYFLSEVSIWSIFMFVNLFLHLVSGWGVCVRSNRQMAPTVQWNFKGNPEAKGAGVVLQGRGKWLAGGKDRGPDARDCLGHGERAKSSWEQFCHLAIHQIPLVLFFVMNLLEKHCISERKASFWVNPLKGVLSEHDLQSRSTDGQRHHVPLQPYPLCKEQSHPWGSMRPLLPTHKGMLPGTLTMPAVWCRESAWLSQRGGRNLPRMWHGGWTLKGGMDLAMQRAE